MQQSQRHERRGGREQPKEQPVQRVEHAGLAVGVERIPAKELGYPERQVAGPPLLGEPLIQRVVEEVSVALERDPAVDESVADEGGGHERDRAQRGEVGGPARQRRPRPYARREPRGTRPGEGQRAQPAYPRRRGGYRTRGRPPLALR